jgi:hypothetical protein
VTGSFDKWSGRIAAAGDEYSRRSILAEIGAWRAAKLSDVAASRHATFAMSRLYAMLGQHDQAVREAHSLLSLCQTPPVATRDETESARAYLTSLGEKAPRVVLPKRQKPKKGSARREVKKAVKEPYGAALAAANEEKWTDGLRAMRGKTGPRADLLRTWLHLNRALGKEDPAARVEDLENLERRLRKTLAIVPPSQSSSSSPSPSTDSAPEKDQARGEDPLSPLLGMRAPRRRDALVRALEKHASMHPDQIDALAAAALHHHVAVQGPRRAAPWLIGTVAHALATTDGVATATAIDALRTAGAFATAAYDEAPFASLLSVLRHGLDAGWGYRGMRRGVSRDEPTSRKLWTLRLARGEAEIFIVRADTQSEPYPEDGAAVLATRILALCPRAALVAAGEGNAGLREACAAAGILVFASDDDVVAGLDQVAAIEAAPEAPKAPAAPRPDALLGDLLTGDEPASIEALVEVLGGFRRRFRAFQVAEKLFGQLPSERIATLLEAVHIEADTDRRIPSGTTLAVRASARSGEDSRVHTLLVSGPTSSRYGGPGIEAVVGVVAALQEKGWLLHRLLQGPTRREREASPVVEALAEHLPGLWRLLVGKGEVRGEVWYVHSLPPEGRAAVPQLLLRDAHRAVVLPIDPDLVSWFGTLGGPAAIGWTGEEGAEVVAAVRAWPSPDPQAP